jgi:cobyrinic acid a,c-diamide synthase
MLAEALHQNTQLRWYGALPRDEQISLPSRHLGLVQGDEIEDLEQRIETAAKALEQSAGSELPPAVAFEPQPVAAIEPLLQGGRIGIARDAAFSFIYPANLRTLQQLGAELVFFSPLADNHLPVVDALWLPGGYPELHLQALSANASLISDVRTHYQAGRPILAECGGMLWMTEELTSLEGQSARLCGLLPAQARMQQRFAALGLQRLQLDGEELRGHTFHHSVTETTLEPVARGECPNGRRAAEPVYRLKRLTASYIHLYFPSNPAAVAQLFRP